MVFRNSAAAYGQSGASWPTRQDDDDWPPQAPRLTDRIGAILMRDEPRRFADPAPRYHPDDEAGFKPDEGMAIEEDHGGDVSRDEAPRRPARSRRRLAAVGAALAACAATGLWVSMPSDGIPAEVRITLSLHTIEDASERLSVLRNEARSLVAPGNLSRVIERARLDRDPEFSGQTSGALGLIADLVSGAEAGDSAQTAQNRLRAAVSTDVDPRENAILLTVRSADAAKSETIAQEIAASYAESAAEKPLRRVDAAAFAAPAAAAPDRGSQKAQADLDAFVAAGGDKVADAVRLKKEVDRLRIENAAAQKRLLDESGRTASGSLASLLDGTFPPELITPTLEDLRARYATARLDVAQLAQALGPRHPRLQSAQALEEGLKSDIEREIRGVFADARAGLQAAQEKAQALAAQSAEAARKLRETGIDVDRLEALQAAVATSRAAADTITTAGIPAAASRPPAPMVERVEKIEPALPESTGPLAGLTAVLALALATGAGFIGLSRLAARRLAVLVMPAPEPVSVPQPAATPTASDHPQRPAARPGRNRDDSAWQSHSRSSHTPEHAPAYPPAFRQDEADPGDIAQLRRDVAALKRRVQDFSDRQYRQRG